MSGKVPLATTENSMQASIAAALTKAAKAVENDARDLPAGKYSGIVRVEVIYTLTKGEQYEQRIVQAACPWKLLAVTLDKLNGVTVASIVREVLAGETDTDSLKEQVESAMLELKGTTVRTCAGKLTGQAIATVITTASQEGAAGV